MVAVCEEGVVITAGDGEGDVVASADGEGAIVDARDGGGDVVAGANGEGANVAARDGGRCHGRRHWDRDGVVVAATRREGAIPSQRRG